MTLAERRNDLLEQRSQLQMYCLGKLKAEDWHAVQDAASDIREIDAQIKLIERVCVEGSIAIT